MWSLGVILYTMLVGRLVSQQNLLISMFLVRHTFCCLYCPCSTFFVFIDRSACACRPLLHRIQYGQSLWCKMMPVAYFRERSILSIKLFFLCFARLHFVQRIKARNVAVFIFQQLTSHKVHRNLGSLFIIELLNKLYSKAVNFF